MIEKIFIVTDLGPGDGGKGGVVHKVCEMADAQLVIKVGGAQGSHGVSTSKGERFAFSQWGCGTFEGIRTHLSSRMVITPEGILNEGDTLIYEYGIHNAFDLLTVDQTALCATPYHGIASRLKELARSDNPRGTIGTGVGEAYRDSTRCPELIIRAEDLSSSDLKDRLAAIRNRIHFDLASIIESGFSDEDQSLVDREIRLLKDDGFLDHIVKRLREVSKRAQIVGHDFLEQQLLSRNGTAVVESSHGVLTDSVFGFDPHTSALRTLPCFTQAMLREAGFKGQFVNLGVTRAYAIRHGAGPLPTNDPEMAEHLLPGSNKDENRYQGKVRVGPMDLVLLRYAIEVCGGPHAFDALAITWFDQIQSNGSWYLCSRYGNAHNQDYFSPSGDIRTWCGLASGQQRYQSLLTQQLLSCKPEVKRFDFAADADRESLFSFCADTLQRELGVPVRMVGFGPTEIDKLCR